MTKLRGLPGFVVLIAFMVAIGVVTVGSEFYGKRTTLKGTDYSGKDLTGCDFSNAHIWNAVFIGTKMVGCNFSNARIYDSSFEGASMAFSQFNGAKIVKTSFADGDMAFADFSGATFLKNRFDGARLSGVLMDGTDLTANTGINVITDKLIITQIVQNRNGLEWVNFSDVLDYNAIAQGNESIRKLGQLQFARQKQKATVEYNKVSEQTRSFGGQRSAIE